MYIQQKPNHKSSAVTTWISIAIIIGCIIAVFIGKRLNNPYQPLNNTKNFNESEIMTKREQDSISNHLEIDFYYLKGCHHCNSVAKSAVPGLKHAKRHDNLIVMNAAPKQMHAYLRENRVYGYPTVAVRYHGNLIYQYTGMNNKIFKKVFNGINPVTGHRFKKQNPRITLRSNSYTQRLTKEPVLSLKNIH